MRTLLQDLKFGLRTLGKNPGFTAVAVLTLALGIGANTAIFSLIDAILLKTLPVSHPEQLVLVRWESPQAKTDALPYPTFAQLRDSSHAFSGMFAFYYLGIATAVDGTPGVAAGQLVSGSYFSVLGVHAIAGRTFTSEEDRVPGGDPVAVISYRYWERQFALNPAAVGKSITLNGCPFTIIGVMAPGFDGIAVGDRREIWIPMMMQAQVMDGRSLLNDPKGWFFQIMARRKPGDSLEQATASLNLAYQQIARQDVGSRITPQVERELASQKLVLLPASKGLSALRERFTQPLLILMALVLLVLLIACANVTSLLLARGSARQKEIAVRAALGAGRVRLIRQLLTESLLLAALGGLLGLLFAHFGDDLLLALPLINGRPLVITLRPDATMLVFTGCVALMAALLFGTAPAWNAARIDLNAALTANTRSVVAGGGSQQSHWGLRKLVVLGEVALSLVLLAGAGMLVRSLLKLRDVNPGFNQDRVLLVGVDPTRVGYRGNRLLNLYKQLVDANATLPGVRSVSLSAVPPMSYRQWRTGVFVQGHRPGTNEDTTTLWNLISPSFFRTLEIPLLQGRDFTPQDDPTAPKVAIVNEAMARFYFGNDSAIGKRLSFVGPEGGEIEIVGLVGDTKCGSLREATPRMLYLPYSQPPSGSLEFDITLEIRTAGNPVSVAGGVRQATRGAGRDVPILGFTTLAEAVNSSLAQERLVAELSSLFGLLALILASVGLYGVMMYTVARRSGEIGIRMALGARRSQVLWMVLQESLELVAVGVVLGIPLAFAFGRLISSQLYGITRGDPLTICAAMILQASIAAIASYVPARRATRVDPMVALRYE
jgi:predicted permease